MEEQIAEEKKLVDTFKKDADLSAKKEKVIQSALELAEKDLAVFQLGLFFMHMCERKRLMSMHVSFLRFVCILFVRGIRKRVLNGNHVMYVP